MVRNFVISAALTFGMLLIGMNVTALGVADAPSVTVAERPPSDAQRAATARALRRAELRVALDARGGVPAVSSPTARPTDVAALRVARRGAPSGGRGSDRAR